MRKKLPVMAWVCLGPASLRRGLGFRTNLDDKEALRSPHPSDASPPLILIYSMGDRCSETDVDE